MKRARCVLLMFALMIAAIALPGTAAAHSGHAGGALAASNFAGAPHHAQVWLQSAPLHAETHHTCGDCCPAAPDGCCMSCAAGAAIFAPAPLIFSQHFSGAIASLPLTAAGVVPDPDPHPPKASPVS